MSKSAEYKKFARECRQLADIMRGKEGRDQLLDIANAWEALAAEHESRLNHLSEFSPLQLAAARAFLLRGVRG